MQTHSAIRYEPSHSSHDVGAAELRVAALVWQPRRRDGVVEFVVALLVLCLIVATSVAYVRGAPVRPAKPVPAAQTAAPAQSVNQ